MSEKRYVRNFAKSALAVTVLMAGALSLTATQAEAEAVNCQTYETNTGADLVGTTGLVICHNKYYVTELHAIHENWGDHAHYGHLRITDNKGHSWDSPSYVVQPGYVINHHFTVNDNVADGTKFCANWVKYDGSSTPGYACKVFRG